MDWSGSLDVEFPFVPESTKNRGRFRRAVHEILADVDFFLTGEVYVRWTLYLHEDLRRRSDKYADCDNYVKTLNDAIKGPAGILIDDTQIQALHVSWQDTRGQECFELTIEGGRDDWTRGPVALFEMHDGLYYPVNIRHAEELVPFLDQIIQRADGVANRISQRLALDRWGDWDLRRAAAPMLMGYHKSRITDSGFRVHSRPEWERDLAAGVEVARRAFTEIEQENA